MRHIEPNDSERFEKPSNSLESNNTCLCYTVKFAGINRTKNRITKTHLYENSSELSRVVISIAIKLYTVIRRGVGLNFQ